MKARETTSTPTVAPLAGMMKSAVVVVKALRPLVPAEPSGPGISTTAGSGHAHPHPVSLIRPTSTPGTLDLQHLFDNCDGDAATGKVWTGLERSLRNRFGNRAGHDSPRSGTAQVNGSLPL